jgi:hypothetical protein
MELLERAVVAILFLRAAAPNRRQHIIRSLKRAVVTIAACVSAYISLIALLILIGVASIRRKHQCIGGVHVIRDGTDKVRREYVGLVALMNGRSLIG